MHSPIPPGADPHSLRRRFGVLRERGASVVEYIGLIVVTTVVIAGLAATPWMPRTTHGIHEVICSIFSKAPGGAPGSCAGVIDPPPTEEELQPECLMTDDTMTRGSEVKIAFVTLGGNMRAQVKTFSDGRTQVTLLDEHSAGARGDLGKLKLGKKFQISAGINGKLIYGNGDTWEFSSPEEAERFVQQAENYVDSNWNYVPLLGPLMNEKPADPRITYNQFRTEGGVDANLGFQKLLGTDAEGNDPKFNIDKGPKAKKGLDVGAEMKFGRDVIVMNDRGDNPDSSEDDTTTYVTTAELGAGARGGGGGNGIGGNAASKGEMRVKVNSKGEIINITFVNTRNADVGAGDDYDDANPEVLTTSLDVETPEQRDIVRNWLMNPTNLDPQWQMFGPPQPNEAGETDPFQRLLYEQAQMSKQRYEGDFVNNDSGLGITLFGLGLGYDRKNQDRSLRLLDSTYYGKPDPDGVRREKPNPKCPA
ncbi:hypothetical protein M3B11_03045 [Brevibacterium sp. p3-SID960]|uniref:hypothetical protein n=1 Tax=Brevibacterium sp. p3-SID960 TaxID=2916063 RepID=UPI0021A3EE48|nr:hypothetical protein [Brevibacterium sp. p3-SID960]MCT1689942.1 hypothetical protein [Brevibacterium sp. p3-SID960]